jgi:ADP-ribosylglycohydrolase
MLVEMAVADAYAIAWEFARKQQTAPIDFKEFLQHPTYVELKPGQYTDDTQRAIANCLVMTSGGPMAEMFNPHTYVDAYLRAYCQDPREGYSRGYQAFIKGIPDADEFLMAISRTKESNGSVMGVAPLGLLPDTEIVKLAATIQAISTHHPITAVDAQIVALSVYYFNQGIDNKECLQGWLMNHVDWVNGRDDAYRWAYLVDQQDEGKPTTIKSSSISSYMVHALTKFDKLSHIIYDAIDRGGDTDSAAAVSVAVASCCPDIENDLPKHLIDAMDVANPGYGVTFMESLEADVRRLYPVE